MAEYGIHHVISNFSKPSIFEVIGHDNLASSLRAAFLHLFKVKTVFSKKIYCRFFSV
uniref:Peroxisome assembly protein 12 n=1 Tax=Parasteatoda tepidariorum TaxID=114398 RepID=A0A2L2Y8K7_PARTP